MLAYFEARLAALVAQAIPARRLAAPMFTGGKLVSGNYYYTASSAATNTSAALGVGTLRVSPWFVPNACTLSRIGAEVSVVGESGSHVRLGIYADNGSCAPGTLVLDAGTILGDSATVQEITISQALTAGMYWVGAVVQDVVTTQPTVRVTSGQNSLGVISAGTAKPAANQLPSGLGVTGVTGALPSTAAWVLVSTQGARTFVKVA